MLRKLASIFVVFFLLPATSALADVVKPALIELSAHKGGNVEIEIRASLEAMLTGITTDYKNTQDAPQAAEYDALRVLDSDALRAEFNAFLPNFLSSIFLSDGTEDAAEITLKAAKIPPAGYTQVPRISVVHLTSKLPASARQVRFDYPVNYGDYAIRVRQIDDAAEKWHWSDWEWVRKGGEAPVFPLTEAFKTRTAWETFQEFAEIGFLHIIPRGLDHILFVLGLFLFSRAWRPLLSQVTMFTLAHTLTLALATLGLISLPDRIVEPLIALSIAYVGLENVWAKSLAQHRLALVFGFGLLHGLGFAGVLADFDMPEDAFTLSLVSFNVGVEIGQIAVIAAAMLLTGGIKSEPHYRRWVAIPASIAIALTGLIWAVQRLQA